MSKISGKDSWADIEITTEASVPQIINLRPVDVGKSSIVLSWELVDDGKVTVIQYEVLHYIKGQVGTAAVNFTRTTNITFKHLQKNTPYAFQVLTTRDMSFLASHDFCHLLIVLKFGLEVRLDAMWSKLFDSLIVFLNFFEKVNFENSSDDKSPCKITQYDEGYLYQIGWKVLTVLKNI